MDEEKRREDRFANPEINLCLVSIGCYLLRCDCKVQSLKVILLYLLFIN